VIALITPAAVESEAVVWEWKTALAYGKRLIPLVIVPCDIPDFIDPRIIRRDLTGEDYAYAPNQIITELEQRWIEVEGNFADLQSELGRHPSDGAARFLTKSLDDLQRKMNTRPTPAMPPEIFEIWFEIIRDLSSAYPDIEEDLNQLAEGSYRESAEWSSRSIFKVQHDFYFKLACTRLNSELDGVRLPVVVVAVTDEQAAQLESEAIFEGEDPVLRQEFAEMRALMESADWSRSYGQKPENWRPFGGTETIHELVLEAASGIRSRGEITDRIVPRYADLMRLDLASELQELRRSSIVVVDYVSTRYPPLQEQFRKSRLDVSTDIPTVVVGLNDRMFNRPPDVRRLIQLHFDREYDRRREPYDPHSDEVWEKAHLLKFLGIQIPRVLGISPLSGDLKKGIQAHFNQFGKP
jgi:hypothetical protein